MSGYELVNWRINFGYSMGKAVAYCADKDGVKTIGFEQDHLTFEKWNSMQAELSAEMVPTLNVIEGLPRDQDAGRDQEPYRCLRYRIQSI